MPPEPTPTAGPDHPALRPDPTSPPDPVHRHPAVRRVAAALAAAGVDSPIVVLDGAARTAAQAAAYLGVEVGQIANSLVFAGQPADGPPAAREPVLILTCGAHRVDPPVAAAALGLAALHRADPDFVREHTGFAIGGVAPVGHLKPIRAAVDRRLAAYEQVWAAGGHPHAVFRTTFADLIRLTGATPVDVR